MGNYRIELPGAAPAFAAFTPARRERGRRIDIYNRSAERRGCLVVNGNLEARLGHCRSISIGESGLFKGSISLDEAEIEGRFEGSLTVRKRILIRSTGIVVGTIRYGQIEIEPGGQISGDVQVVERPD
jgi:cytoskeletal protein CcmA (bactofilin family)